MEKKKKTVKKSIFTILLLVVVLGTTYAFTSRIVEGIKRQELIAGILDLDLLEGEEVTLENLYPIANEVGLIQEESYDFKLTNKTTNKADYKVKLRKIDVEEELLLEEVVYGLTKDGKSTTAILSEIEDGVIDSGTIEGNQTINYELRFWLRESVSDDTTTYGKSLKYRVDVEVNQEEYDVNGCKVLAETEPNAPELTSGMIAVTYNETDKTWIKADISNNNWYDYENQVWANAVTVTKETRESYMNAKAGTPILMNDINTMWVWIPRYSYTIRDTYGVQLEGCLTPTQSTPGAIDIKFISTGEKNSGTGTCAKCASNWVTPEGFTFGKEEIPGFWIGKFETSILESCVAANDVIGVGCDLNSLTPQVKPNVKSWRGARVSTFFTVSRLMQSSDNANIYGFDVEGTGTMDTHMLKNSEWGIVAMLSQSKYGKYGNPNYTGANKEVYQNKSSSYITGSSNGTPNQEAANTQVTYDTPDTGYGASTTGTIYGVYDMSGGSYEYVMGNYNNISGQTTSSNSGFCGTNGPTDGICREWPNTKYFDLYTSEIPSVGYKLGDAMYETSGWYSDIANFIVSDNPWVDRGGGFSSSTTSGVFYFSRNTGKSLGSNTSRLAIKP